MASPESCASGYEQDLFNSGGNCTIPAAFYRFMGSVGVAVYSIGILLHVYSHGSADANFWDRDTEGMARVISGMLESCAIIGVLEPLVHLENTGSPSLQVQIFTTLAFVANSVTILLSVYRTVKQGIRYAFPLRLDMPSIVRRVNGLQSANLLVSTVVMARATLLMVTSKEKSDRLQMLVSFVTLNFVLPIILYTISVWESSVALRQLPRNSQSRSIRRKLEVFRRRCYVQIVIFVIVLSMLGLLFPLHDYMISAILGAHLLFYGGGQLAIGVIKIVKRAKKSKRKMIHVQPPVGKDAGTRMLLSGLEEAGKVACATAEGVNLPLAAHQAGMCGVSFALLKVFQEENVIPDEWSMTDVCANLIKKKILYRKGSTVAQGAGNATRSTSAASAWSTEEEQQPYMHRAYAELVGHGRDTSGKPFVSTPTHFFSYAWSCSWRVVFDAIEAFEQQQMEGGEDQSYVCVVCVCSVCV
jgi:hypothetical protein